MPVFALVVARKGLKPGPKLIANTGAPFQFDIEPGPTLICRKVSMAQLVSWLKIFLFAERPVIDRTGLAGEYDFTLHWTPEPRVAKESIPAPNASGQALQAALLAQLGLQLEPQKAPVNTYVIEQAERPSGH